MPTRTVNSNIAATRIRLQVHRISVADRETRHPGIGVAEKPGNLNGDRLAWEAAVVVTLVSNRHRVPVGAPRDHIAVSQTGARDAVIDRLIADIAAVSLIDAFAPHRIHHVRAKRRHNRRRIPTQTRRANTHPNCPT